MHRTLQPTVPSGIVNSMFSATVGAWTTFHTFTVDYWLGALRRGATPFDLAGDLATWTAEMADRHRPPWSHEHHVVKEWPIARLRDYSTPDADSSMVATVIVPPQAGHDSSIVDFAAGQSQIITGRENGCHRIYSLDWIGATQETKDTGIDDYMSMLRETVDLLGGKINLVGDCQGGWLATIFAALYPEKVNSLAIAGAPIDFHAGEPLIHDWLTVLAPGGDMSFFRSAVKANGGLLPGRFLLDGFKALEPDQELARKLQLLTNLDDPQYIERYRKFENWFQWTQALPGAFYLWVVEHLFIRNSLIKGELVVEGRTVDLKAIDCPVFLMAGLTDHITPADQVWALADYVATPPERIGRQSAGSGHLGLFMSREALKQHWNVIFEEMAALSTPDPQDDPDVLTDEPTGSRPTAPGVARSDAPAVQDALPTVPASTRKAPARKTPARKAAARKAPARKTSAAKTAETTASAGTADASVATTESPAKAPSATMTPAAKAPTAAKTPAAKAPTATRTPAAKAPTAAKTPAAKTPTAKETTAEAPTAKATTPKATADKVPAVEETTTTSPAENPSVKKTASSPTTSSAAATPGRTPESASEATPPADASKGSPRTEG